MKKLFAMLLMFLFVLTIFVQPVMANEPSTIIVNGTGTVTVSPDFATLRLGVVTQNAAIGPALTENNALAAAVISAVRQLGVEEEDVRTANFSLQPLRDRNWVEIPGHSVTNTVIVTVRDIDKTGDIIGAAIEAGATVSGGISFGITDSSAAYHEALGLAVQNARGRAQAIAGAMNYRISGVVNVTENSGTHTPVAREVMAMEEMRTADAGWSVPIEVGVLSVTANVRIIYEVVPQ